MVPNMHVEMPFPVLIDICYVQQLTTAIEKSKQTISWLSQNAIFAKGRAVWGLPL